jgi:DNA-binding transcriptional regulator YdaS (Cro superfamily)
MKTPEAIEMYVTQESLAEALGLKQPSINRWVKTGEIPYLRQLQLESLSGGRLKADNGILPRRQRQPKAEA